MNKCPVCGGNAEVLFNLVSCGNSSCRLFYRTKIAGRSPHWTHNDTSDTYLGTEELNQIPCDFYISDGLGYLMYRFGNDFADFNICSVYDYRLGRNANDGFRLAYEAACKAGFLRP